MTIARSVRPIDESTTDATGAGFEAPNGIARYLRRRSDSNDHRHGPSPKALGRGSAAVAISLGLFFSRYRSAVAVARSIGSTCRPSGVNMAPGIWAQKWRSSDSNLCWMMWSTASPSGRRSCPSALRASSRPSLIGTSRASMRIPLQPWSPKGAKLGQMCPMPVSGWTNFVGTAAGGLAGSAGDVSRLSEQ